MSCRTDKATIRPFHVDVPEAELTKLRRRIKLIHYNKLDKGGHFAAWEQPKLFVEEVRAGLRSLRNAI